MKVLCIRRLNLTAEIEGVSTCCTSCFRNMQQYSPSFLRLHVKNVHILGIPRLYPTAAAVVVKLKVCMRRLNLTAEIERVSTCCTLCFGYMLKYSHGVAVVARHARSVMIEAPVITRVSSRCTQYSKRVNAQFEVPHLCNGRLWSDQRC